jgi:hypothetical protein
MSDPHHPRRQLWLIAQRFITTLFNLFGEPAEIAARHTILRDEWRIILSWLRAGEALMRQLLLIEAASLPKPNTRPILWAKRERKRRELSFSAEAPQDWRVSFRMFTPTFPGRSARRGEPGPIVQHAAADEWTPAQHVQAWPGSVEHAARFKSAWPIAERIEALLRVFNNPEPYARRLAARLYAKPHRAASLTRHPDNLRHVITDYFTLRDAVFGALPRFESG